jgi:sigma-54 dependent transcriptional regulator, acetoin dehydrogenase operon transcriptional activator AcoR
MQISIEKCTDTIGSSWQNFIMSSQINAGAFPKVKKDILDSWIRCRKASTDPMEHRVHAGLGANSLAVLLEQNTELIEIAKPFMQNLYEVVAGSGFVVALTDVRGYIMEIMGDRDTLQNPMTVSFYQGASWSENEAGTNAIGTALVLKKPIQVSGPEHYCRQHHGLTCSASPILDMGGNLLGALDISGASAAAHLHTLGMAVAGAEAIMAQLSIRNKNHELKITNQRLTNIFNTMSDGVIVVNSKGIISEMNPIARQILGFDQHQSEIKPGFQIESVFREKCAFIYRTLERCEACADVELMLDSGKGLLHCLVSVEPITDEQGKVLGGVILLRSIQQVQDLVNRFSGHYGTLQFSDIIGTSQGISEAVRIASLAANSMSNVLLQGESGTGKEIFAQAIHNKSDRRGGPFIAVNCGAIPRELIGSELFGYTDGAFTGAKRGGKPGKFELAGGGTLFLDEISDMPLEQQVALLRVIQERSVTRLGGDKLIPVDVRIICATNKNLKEEVEKGTFRKDLYYRLHVISIMIPPLRERFEDIVQLFNYFLERLDKHDRGFSIDPEVLVQIQQYTWPGNVRELQNVVERIVSLTEGHRLTLENMPQEILRYQPADRHDSEKTADAEGDSSLPGGEASYWREQRRRELEHHEKGKILKLLSKFGGNVSLTAKSMGISRNTLYRKMKQYGIYN